MRVVFGTSVGLLCAFNVLAQQGRGDAAGTIERADRTFARAMVQSDLGALASTYADDYVFTDPTGRVSHKADLLDSFRRGVIKIRSQEITDVQVNVYGTVAVEFGKLVSL